MPQQFLGLMPDGQYVAVFSYHSGSQRVGAGVVIGAEYVVGIWFGCAGPRRSDRTGGDRGHPSPTDVARDVNTR